MTYDFYWISGSPNAWRAMLTLEYKNIPYTSHRLDFAKGENRTPEYLTMNPRGKVPTLRDGETVIHESIAIMAFLERAHPEKPVFGTTPAETGLIWQRILEMVNFTRDPIEDGVIRPLIRGKAKDDADAIRAAASDAADSLGWVEDALSLSPYLAGDALSAADIAAVTTISFLARAGKRADAIELGLGFDRLSFNYPAIAAWLGRMTEMDGWDAAYPPHWKD